jgi:FecR-like protein
MSRCRSWGSALLLMAPFALQATPSDAMNRIGVATSIRPNAEGVVGANLQMLSPGSELYANETVRTGNLGHADLVFIDNTNLTVGPTSEVLLDEFVYGSSGSAGRFVMQASRGTFRVATGTQVDSEYQVKTPDGTLDMRGAVVEFVVQPKEPQSKKRKTAHRDQCDTMVRLVKGRARYRTISGKTAELTERGTVVCVTAVGNMSYATSAESILSPDPVIVIPPTVVVDPPPPCVSPTTLNCR